MDPQDLTILLLWEQLCFYDGHPVVTPEQMRFPSTLTKKGRKSKLEIFIT